MSQDINLFFLYKVILEFAIRQIRESILNLI